MKNHNFAPRALDNHHLCATCNREQVSHGDKAICEACGAIGEAEIFGKSSNPRAMLLCDACTQKEIDANTAIIERHKNDVSNTTYHGYFNHNITPIAVLKDVYEINGNLTELHILIQNQIETFQKVLFEAKPRENEHAKLVIELRAEFRTQITQQDINYQPPVKAPKVSIPKIKKNPLEKMAEMIVGAAAKRGEVITIEDALRKLNAELGNE